MRQVSDKGGKENKKKTRFMLNNFFLPVNPARLWDNVEKCGTAGQTTDDNMAHANCMPDTWDYKHTHTQYIIFITVPLQQWLHERTSM